MKIVFQVNGGIGDNFIDSNATSPATCGVIAGGFKNKDCAGIHYSSIFGGHKNTVAGNCSSILGGFNNYDGGYDNVFIAGSGIALSATVGNPNSLHVNGLWANGIPDGTLGPFNTGTIFWLPVGVVPTFPVTGALWIQ